MSAASNETIVNPALQYENNEVLGQDQPARNTSQRKNYKGFVAGVFSGISKLTGKMNQID